MLSRSSLGSSWWHGARRVYQLPGCLVRATGLSASFDSDARGSDVPVPAVTVLGVAMVLVSLFVAQGSERAASQQQRCGGVRWPELVPLLRLAPSCCTYHPSPLTLLTFSCKNKSCLCLHTLHNTLFFFWKCSNIPGT